MRITAMTSSFLHLHCLGLRKVGRVACRVSCDVPQEVSYVITGIPDDEPDEDENFNNCISCDAIIENAPTQIEYGDVLQERLYAIYYGNTTHDIDYMQVLKTFILYNGCSLMCLACRDAFVNQLGPTITQMWDMYFKNTESGESERNFLRRIIELVPSLKLLSIIGAYSYDEERLKALEGIVKSSEITALHSTELLEDIQFGLAVTRHGKEGAEEYIRGMLADPTGFNKIIAFVIQRVEAQGAAAKAAVDLLSFIDHSRFDVEDVAVQSLILCLAFVPTNCESSCLFEFLRPLLCKMPEKQAEALFSTLHQYAGEDIMAKWLMMCPLNILEILPEYYIFHLASYSISEPYITAILDYFIDVRYLTVNRLVKYAPVFLSSMHGYKYVKYILNKVHVLIQDKKNEQDDLVNLAQFFKRENLFSFVGKLLPYIEDVEFCKYWRPYVLNTMIGSTFLLQYVEKDIARTPQAEGQVLSVFEAPAGKFFTRYFPNLLYGLIKRKRFREVKEVVIVFFQNSQFYGLLQCTQIFDLSTALRTQRDCCSLLILFYESDYPVEYKTIMSVLILRNILKTRDGTEIYSDRANMLVNPSQHCNMIKWTEEFERSEDHLQYLLSHGSLELVRHLEKTRNVSFYYVLCDYLRLLSDLGAFLFE